MKKLMMGVLLPVLFAGSVNIFGYNDARAITNEMIKEDTQNIDVKNKSGKDLYFGVYKVTKNEKPELFGNVFFIPTGSKFTLRRPAKPGKADVRLYFSLNSTDILPDIFPESDFAKKAVCGSKGKTFCLDANKGTFSDNDEFEIKPKYLEIKKK